MLRFHESFSGPPALPSWKAGMALGVAIKMVRGLQGSDSSRFRDQFWGESARLWFVGDEVVGRTALPGPRDARRVPSGEKVRGACLNGPLPNPLPGTAIMSPPRCTNWRSPWPQKSSSSRPSNFTNPRSPCGVTSKERPAKTGSSVCFQIRLAELGSQMGIEPIQMPLFVWVGGPFAQQRGAFGHLVQQVRDLFVVVGVPLPIDEIFEPLKVVLSNPRCRIGVQNFLPDIKYHRGAVSLEKAWRRLPLGRKIVDLVGRHLG